MTTVIQYNIAKDTRSWFSRLMGDPAPVVYSCYDPLIVMDRANEQNRINSARWGGKIGKIHLPRKPKEGA
jgi:hypothetical protein